MSASINDLQCATLTQEQLDLLGAKVSSKIHVLVVDDNETMLAALSALLRPPYFAVQCAPSLQQARMAITGKPPGYWHGWIVDVSLGAEDGLSLLVEFPNFPFAIVLSGMGSMEVAHRASRMGAIGVLDKTPDSFDRIFPVMCKTAALGFLLRGTATKYLQTFLLLSGGQVADPQQWSEKACMTLRQLERITIQHTGLAPRYALPLYYALEYLLLRTPGLKAAYCPEGQDRLFYDSAAAFVARTMDRYGEYLQ